MQLISFAKQLARNWTAHDNTRSAAAIAFYAIFTLAPMLVFATVGLGWFVGPKQAQSLTEAKLENAIGPSGSDVAHQILANADFSRHGYATTFVSALVLLYGASAIFFQLRKALDRIFGRPLQTVREAMIASLLSRLVAAVCVIVATSLLAATLVAQVVLQSLSKELLAKSTISESQWQLASTAMTVIIVSLVIIALLKFLPSQPPAWRHVMWGAIVSVVLFELGKWLFGMYISRSAIASAYGPSSTIVAFILWIYYSTQIFILGAEICQLSAERRQS